MRAITRRNFLDYSSVLALGGAASLTLPRSARAAAMTLKVGTRQIEVNGKSATVFGIQQPDGTHGLTLDGGSNFAVLLENALKEPTLVHWHGLTPPWRQDGTPGVTQEPIAAGANATYDFTLNRTGTFWMHSHLGFQEQALLAAPLIVRNADDRSRDEQEVVVLLHDFSFKTPEEIFAGLRGSGLDKMMDDGMAAMHGSGGGMGMSGMGGMAAADTHAAAAMPGMSDLNDIEYDAFLANDRTLDDPAVIKVAANGRVRLRIINGSAATNFTVDLGALTGELIAVDGNPIVPVTGQRFPIAMAQRLDIRLTVPAGAAAPILALREGGPQRTGVILQPAGAAVAKIGTSGTADGPTLDLTLEQALKSPTPLAPRPADRTVPITLIGNMTGYLWGIDMNGATLNKLMVKTGERVEIAMRNNSPMAHPMHLHGHHFQVIQIGDRAIAGAIRDTVLVPPNSEVRVAFDADNAGKWAFHCHSLYHMNAGMMTTVEYEGVA